MVLQATMREVDLKEKVTHWAARSGVCPVRDYLTDIHYIALQPIRHPNLVACVRTGMATEIKKPMYVH